MDYLWTPWRYQYITAHGESKHGRKGVPPELAAWPGDLDCVFCNLIASADYAISAGMPQQDAERAALIVYRAERVFVCLNRFPYNSGHLMVLPYSHGNSLAALAAPTAHALIEQAQRAETALRRVYTPDGLNMGINLGTAAGAGVAGHLHVHALPRWEGDTSFMTVTGETRTLPEALEVTWERLREAFLSLDSAVE
ncbi:MAG TPA: HIT domain-containing protein [Acidobacteriaceae bacterium]